MSDNGQDTEEIDPELPITEITIVAGDDSGGPHMWVTVQGTKPAEELDEEDFEMFRSNTREAYVRAFECEPQSIIVTVCDIIYERVEGAEPA